jgi:putative DNA primase/helicase
VNAAVIAHALGGMRKEGRGWRCRCPVHGGSSLVVCDGREGRLLVKCWGGNCSVEDIFRELRARRLIGTGGGMPNLQSSPPGRVIDANRITAARQLWDVAKDAGRSREVMSYFASRGITMPPPPSLRWIPRCWHREAHAYLPAIVGCVEHIERGFVGCHRTYLTPDYRCRDRATLGSISGGAVRLAPAAELLMIAEGIETALAAMQACCLPAWAALSMSGLMRLVLPTNVRAVLILADNDYNGAGQRAAHAAGQRWVAEGRRVQVALPPEPGTDFNDVLRGRAHPRINDGLPDVAA